MENFNKYLTELKLSENTINKYVLKLKDFTDWIEQKNIDLEYLSYTDLLLYISHLQRKGISRQYQNQLIGIVRHYLDFKVKIGQMKANPAKQLFIRGVQRRIPHNLLTNKQLNDIYENYHVKTNLQKRNKIILGLLVYQALTIQDLTNLKTEHLRLKEGKIYIPETPKTNSRILSLEAHQIYDLMEYTTSTRSHLLNETEKQSDFLLFSSGSGNKLNNSLLKLFSTLKKTNSELKNASQIRASVIANKLKSNDLRQVQYFAGHKWVSSTERYLMDDIEGLQKSIDKFHPIKS